MEDREVIKLMELLAEYGSDYPEEANATTTVQQVVDDLTQSVDPTPRGDEAARKALEVWKPGQS